MDDAYDLDKRVSKNKPWNAHHNYNSVISNNKSHIVEE
jgi:hypothetical protein